MRWKRDEGGKWMRNLRSFRFLSVLASCDLESLLSLARNKTIMQLS